MKTLTLIVFAMFLFSCEEKTQQRKAVEAKDLQLLYTTEWRNDDGISISFDTVARIFDKDLRNMRAYYFKLGEDTLTFAPDYWEFKDTFPPYSFILYIELLTKDTLILSPISVKETYDFSITKKTKLKAERLFQNKELELDSLIISAGGWGPLIEFELKKDSIKYFGINYQFEGGFLAGTPDSILYEGLLSKKIRKEFNYLFQLSEIESLQESYPEYTHSPIYEMEFFYNGNIKKSRGGEFPRGIHKIIEKLLWLKKADFIKSSTKKNVALHYAKQIELIKNRKIVDSASFSFQHFITEKVLKGKYKVELAKYMKNKCVPFHHNKANLIQSFEGFQNIGDIDNDNEDDFVFVLPPLSHCEEGESYYFSNPKIERIYTISLCCHPYSIFSIGDIDEDGSNEIAQYYSSCASNYKLINVWTLKTNKWKKIAEFNYFMNNKYKVFEDFDKLYRKLSKGVFQFLDIENINEKGELVTEWKTIKMN